VSVGEGVSEIVGDTREAESVPLTPQGLRDGQPHPTHPALRAPVAQIAHASRITPPAHSIATAHPHAGRDFMSADSPSSAEA
jgi:hypothetical protein